jgi:hypothetical protein
MAPAAFAQAPAEPQEVECAGEEVDANDVSVCEVPQLLVDAGYALGIVREDALLFGIVPRPAMTGYGGTWVDIEADPAGPALEVERYDIAPDWRIPALREDVLLANGDRIVRVVKGDRAWNESPAPGMNPEVVNDANIIALRTARMWMTPSAPPRSRPRGFARPTTRRTPTTWCPARTTRLRSTATTSRSPSAVRPST